MPRVWTKAPIRCQRFSKGFLQSFFTTTSKRNKNIWECTTAELCLTGGVHSHAQKIRRPVWSSAAWAWAHQRKDEKFNFCCSDIWILTWSSSLVLSTPFLDSSDEHRGSSEGCSDGDCLRAVRRSLSTAVVPWCSLQPGGKRAVKGRESKRSV